MKNLIKNRLLLGAFALTLLVGGLVPLTVSAVHTKAIQIGINPSDRPDNEKTKLVYEIRPTKSVEDVLTIANYSADQAYRLKVYAVDAIQSTDGAIAFKLENKEQQLVGQWTSFGQEEVVVEPGKSAYLPYRITLPAQVSPGTYQGGLVAEIVNEEQPASSGQNQIRVMARLIEPVYISVPGRKQLKYNLDEFSYSESNGVPCFSIKFSNRGNVFLTGEVDMNIEGTLLEKPYLVSLNHPTILQQESMVKTFRFENPPLFGEYRAELTFKVYEYDPLTDSPRLLDTIRQQIRFNIVPYHCIIALIIIIILAVVAGKYGFRYVKTHTEETFLHVAKKGETIISIADLYQVNWKKIVKLNKLRRPYTIHAGDRINLPLPPVSPTPPTGKKSK